ncbi:hypothetical protein KAU33_15495 [Candidatus Dependentiae bacterium]|nr:hypothetical protein [Candidatus Dependentiae bacterium]
MARYLLFAGDDYEPRGGMNDFVKGFKTKPELMKFLRENPDEYIDDWWHVADTVKCEIVLHDYEFNAEHRFIRCGDCGDILKIVPKSEKPELGEETIMCETCQSFHDRHGELYEPTED